MQVKASSMWYTWLYPWCLFILCTTLSCFEELAAYSPGQRKAEIRVSDAHSVPELGLLVPSGAAVGTYQV